MANFETSHNGNCYLSIFKDKDTIYSAYGAQGDINVDTPTFVINNDKSNWEIIDCNSDIRTDTEATEQERLYNNPNALIDGTTSQWWRSIYRYYQDLPYYAVIDFGRTISIDNFTFEIPASSNKRYANNKHGYLEVSVDNYNWNYLCDWESPSAATQKISVEFDKINTRYLKFVIDGVFKDASNGGSISNPNATGIGEISVGCQIGGDRRYIAQSENKSSFILSSLKDYVFGQFEVEDDEYIMHPYKILYHNEYIYVVGSESDSVSNRIFIVEAKKTDLSDCRKLTFDLSERNIDFYEISSVTQTDEGEIIFVVEGRYNSDSDISNAKIYKRGDFANITKICMLIDDDLIPIGDIDDALSISIFGPYIAISHFGESGNEYSLNKISITGIEDIKVSKSDIVTYYNLQGFKVNNPTKGLYVVKRGNMVSKEYY